MLSVQVSVKIMAITTVSLIRGRTEVETLYKHAVVGLCDVYSMARNAGDGNIWQAAPIQCSYLVRF